MDQERKDSTIKEKSGNNSEKTSSDEENDTSEIRNDEELRLIQNFIDFVPPTNVFSEEKSESFFVLERNGRNEKPSSSIDEARNIGSSVWSNQINDTSASDEWPLLSFEELLRRPVPSSPYYMLPLIPSTTPTTPSSSLYDPVYTSNSRLFQRGEETNHFPYFRNHQEIFPGTFSSVNSESPSDDFYRNLRQNLDQAVEAEIEQEVNQSPRNYPLDSLNDNSITNSPYLTTLPIGYLPISGISGLFLQNQEDEEERIELSQRQSILPQNFFDRDFPETLRIPDDSRPYALMEPWNLEQVEEIVRVSQQVRIGTSSAFLTRRSSNLQEPEATQRSSSLESSEEINPTDPSFIAIEQNLMRIMDSPESPRSPRVSPRESPRENPPQRFIDHTKNHFLKR